jgi:peptidoglycan/LPS O-acetylase OafA/YrhL
MLQTLQSPLSIPAEETTEKVRKMEAITALRFVAALMVLTIHILGTFDLLFTSPVNNIGLWQALSWFFVLSGFIMVYVHPRLDDTTAVHQYYIARFARIWPTYFVSFCLYVALVPDCTKSANAGLFAALYLLMLQSWTLVKPAVKCFNTPGWSVSAELFFYLYFPILLRGFAQHWKKKLLFTFSLVVLSIIAAALAAWPEFTPTVNLDVNVNPLCRLFEFSLGMATCLAYKKYSGGLQWTKNKATILEILAICGSTFCLFLPRLMPVFENHYWLNPVRIYFDFCGAAPCHAIVIFLFACERGAISQFITKRIFVNLGEMTYSIYLFHLPVLMYFQDHYDKNKDGALLSAICFATIIFFALSRLNLLLIETPCRKAIITLGKKLIPRKVGMSSAKAPSTIQTIKDSFAFPRARIIEIAVLSSLIGLTCGVNYLQERHFRFVSEKTVAANLPRSNPEFRQVIFGDAFALRGLIKKESKDGIHLRLFWQSLRDQKLDYGNGIHLLDANGQVISYHDYFQDNAQRRVKKNQFWQDEFFLSADKLNNAAAIGLAVYSTKPLEMLIVKGGPMDSSGRKLLIPVKVSARAGNKVWAEI